MKAVLKPAFIKIPALPLHFNHEELEMFGNTFSITDAGNTYNPALLVMRSRGYQLRIEEFDESNIWHATKDNASFSANNPLALLALTVIWENYGEDWNQQEPSVLRELCNKEDE